MEYAQVLETLGTITQRRAVRVEGTNAYVIQHAGPSAEIRVLQEGVGVRYSVPLGTMRDLWDFARVPQHLGRNLQPETMSQVLTEQIRQAVPFNLIVEDQEVVALVGGHEAQYPIAVDAVLEAIETAFPGTEYRRALVFPNQAVQLEVVSTVPAAVVRTGDLVRAGALVEFSPLGFTQPAVRSYVERLACTNGMVSTEVFEVYQLDEEGTVPFRDWFVTSLRSAFGGLQNVVGRWRAMAAEELSSQDRGLVLSGLLRQARLSAREREVVLARVVEEPMETTYDALQLLTWASSHVLTDPVRVQRAQLAAARFADETLHSRFCVACRRES